MHLTETFSRRLNELASRILEKYKVLYKVEANFFKLLIGCEIFLIYGRRSLYKYLEGLWRYVSFHSMD